ncbi:hypothetical protein BGZ60DRAFT_248614 [Tricladium varicosporioides]|nr:hypothetical protein BGZ60DRAFT_248614 [Hymenoscyphus varicosporioides]
MQDGKNGAGQLRGPVAVRGWGRSTEDNRSRPGAHSLDRVSENVSPLSSSSPAEDNVPMSAITMDFDPYVHTAEDYSVQHASTVPQVVVVKRKPVPTERPLPNLPEEPRSLEEITNEKVLDSNGRGVSEKSSRRPRVLKNLIFVLISIPFFAFAIRFSTLDGKPTRDRQDWETLQNLMKVAGTFFPIAFAFLVGRAAMKVAAYLLEHGVALGILEQLVGSRTVSNTIATQFHLRSFNVLGAGLVVLWILSPIGSQGVLRLLYPALIFRTDPAVMEYFSTDSQSMFASGNPIMSNAVQASMFKSMFTAALISPVHTKLGHTDLWTNVRIPYLSSLQTVGGDTWATISPNDTFAYSSLAGIPITGLRDGNTSFSIESSYMELHCENITSSQPLDLLPFDRDVDANSTPYSMENGTYHGTNANATLPTSNSTTATWSLGLDMFISSKFNSSLSTNSSLKTCHSGSTGFLASPCYLHNISESQAFQGTLLFQSLPVPPTETVEPPLAILAHTAKCPVQQVYVQSKISCTQQPNLPTECRVTAQRHSQMSHTPNYITPLSFPEIFDPISLYLPRTFSAAQSGTRSDPSIFYINNPEPGSIMTGTGAADLLQTPAQALSYRLGQIINTYYTLSQAYPLIAEGSPAYISENITALATNTIIEEHYHVSWAWFTFLFLATLIMFLSSLLAAVLDYKLENPEVLGYASSIMRDSPFVELSGVDRKVGGARLTRMNKELRLRIGDIGQGDQVRIAVLREEDARGRKIDRESGVYV